MPALVLPPPAAYLPLAAVLLVAGLIACAAAVALMARGLLQPPRMTDGKAAWVLKRLSPGDLGMPFEEMWFTVRAEPSRAPTDVAAWWVPNTSPAAAGRCAVLLHGYADAKVGAIAWAPTFHALGFHLLVPDLRAHGESGGSLCTGGYFERHDVAQIVHQLRAGRPDDTRKLVLFGASLGAAVAAAAAALQEEAPGGKTGGPPSRPALGVDAVVLDSPFADFGHAAVTHLDWLGAPGRLLQRAAVALAQRMAGADFAAVRLADCVARLPCPVLVIAPAHDPFLPPARLQEVEAALAARPPSGGGGVWRVEGAGHLGALAGDPAVYLRRLDTFLTGALGPGAPHPVGTSGTGAVAGV